MANKIQVRRGAIANLPTLSLGEPALTTDTNRMFIGGNGGNVELATVAWAKDTFSNANLLINSNFKNAVNQRGQTSYTESTGASRVYTIDRWFVVRASISISSNGVTLSPANASVYGVFGTFLEEDCSNRTVAISAKIDGVIYTVSGMPNTTPENVQVITPFGVFRVWISSGHTYVEFNIDTTVSPILIEWVKLELGAVATPFAPKPYVEELQDCLMYDGENLTTPYSNPNLLLNSNFLNPINLGGKTKYNNQYGGFTTISKWYNAMDIQYGTLVQITSTGINFALQNGVLWGLLVQEIKFPSSYIGKTFTISAKINGEIITKTDTLVDATNSNGILSFYYDTSKNSIIARFGIGGDTGITSLNNIEWVKLEQGSIATPFVPKPYVEELQDCLMYDGENLTTPYSNPNLLINTNLKNAVNQRGQTSYSGTGIYTIDRWKTIGDGSLTVAVNSDSITLSNASADIAFLYQEIENGSKFQGENITTSANVISYSGTCAVGFYDGVDKRANVTSTGVQSYTGQVDASASVLRYVFTLVSGASITISWVKLEFGSIATPFVPKPYGEELALCKRYYEKLLWRSFKRTYDYKLFALVTFADKRIGSPTVTCISTAETIGKVSGWNGAAYTDLDYTTGFLTNNSVRIETAENTSMINYDFHIVIDAEL